MGNVFGPYYREILRKKVSAVKLENKKIPQNASYFIFQNFLELKSHEFFFKYEFCAGQNLYKDLWIFYKKYEWEQLSPLFQNLLIQRLIV